ncbi:MAG: flavodoxin [Eubacteriales bacterium]|jgi:flavodoxin
MNPIVIYYSFEGNSEAAAKKAAELTGAEIVQIRTEKEPPRSGFKFLVGGRQALSGFRPRIEMPEIDYSKYDTVILACPVWAGTMAPAMLSYLKKHAFSGKKVYLIGCSASGNADKMFAKMSELLEGNAIVGQFSLRSPLKNSEELNKLEPLASQQ